MKNALIYFIKIILFLALWFLQMAVGSYFVMEYYGELRPNSSIVIIGITAIFLSYRMVKRINVSLPFSSKKTQTKKEEVIITANERPSLFKRFTYTFLWGYLALKWRRLLRVLTVLWLTVIIPIILSIFEEDELDKIYEELFELLFFQSEYIDAEFSLMIWLFMLSPIFLISWVVKPFIMDKKN